MNAEICFGRVLLAANFHLDEIIRPADDFVGDHLLFLGHFLMPAAHEALDRENGVFGVGNLLVFSGLTDEPFTLLGKCDDRRRQPAALGVDQHLGLIPFHDGDHAVGRPEVNSNDLCHCGLAPLEAFWHVQDS